MTIISNPVPFSLCLCVFVVVSASPPSPQGQQDVIASQQRAARPGKDGPAETALSAGLEAYQSGRLDRAIAKLKEAFALSPDNPQVRLYLGLFLYEKANDSLEAQHLMESELDHFPLHGDLQLRLLDSYLRTKDETKIDALLGRLQGRMSADSRFAFNVVYTLIHYGRIPSAKEEISKISKNLQGEVLFIGGLIALGSEENQDALKLFQDASGHGFPPRDSKQMLTLAECYFRLRQFNQAARAYEAYLEHHSETAPAHRFQLGLCYYACGDFNHSLEQMLKVRQQAPLLPEINLYLGSLLIELKRVEEARGYLHAELEREPGSYKAMAKVAYLEYLSGNNDLCREWLGKSLDKNRRWFETQMVFGLLYNRLGQYEKAVESLENCLREEPEYPKAHFQLSQAYRRLGNEEKAAQYLESFNRLQNAATARALSALGLSDKNPNR